MFKKATRDILKELDLGNVFHPALNPVDNIDLLTVVKIVQSRKLLFFSTKSYQPTLVKLQDLILPGDTVDFGQISQRDVGSFAIKNSVDGSVHASSTIECGAVKTEASCDVAQSRVFHTKLERVHISPTELHKGMQARELNHDHHLIKDMKKNSRLVGLGVVYDILKCKTPLCLQQNFGGKGTAKFACWKFLELDGHVKTDSMKTLDLDAGCVLGYNLQDIPIELEECPIKMTRTLLTDDGPAVLSAYVDGLPHSADGAVDFSALKQKVHESYRVFRDMGVDVKMLLWNLLSEILRCTETLHVLDRILEEAFLSANDASTLECEPLPLRPKLQELLSILELNSERVSDHPFLSPLSLLVSSLTETDEEAVTLIVTLNQEVLSQVLSSVETLLGNVCSSTVEGVSWSTVFSGSYADVAKNVLKASGVMLDERTRYPALGAPGDLDMSLVSLYIALTGLSLVITP